MVRSRDREARLNEIIEILFKNPGTQYKTIKEKTGLSDPVLSKYLKVLTDEKTLEVIKTGREKFYNLSKTAFKKQDMEYLKSIIMYRMKFAVTVGLGEKNLDDVCKNIEKDIGALFFHFILDGLNDGKNRFSEFRINDFAISVTSMLLEIIMGGFIPEKVHKKIVQEDLDGIFQEFSKIKLGDLEADRFQEIEDEIINRYEKNLSKLTSTDI